MPGALTLLDSTASRPGLVPGAFECICRDAGLDSVRVRVGGELDIATSPLLEHTLRNAELHARQVVLDLRDLTFIDSSGMRVIVDASLRARRAERELILVRGPSHVDRVFRLTGNSNGLEIRDLDPLEPPVQVLPQVAQEDHAA
jgi:anti-sigma B factor antagonist